MIVLVNYGAGNLPSVQNALQYLGYSSEITDDPKKVEMAEKIIFPGVGAAASSMLALQAGGLGLAVAQAVARSKPVLGICLGCQIILEKSAEDGGVSCLGILPGQAVRFKQERGLKVPHMGWNAINLRREHPLFSGLGGAHFYFVHSYFPQVDDSLEIANTTYGSQLFSSVIGRKNLVATQFHTEKSGEAGLMVLRNFCRWDGLC